MGNNEEGKSSKSDKSSSPAPPETNIHVYPDWAAMQAYYGPRVPIPPYYNSAVASGHAPHPYMWGPPQPMMPPYGAPYAAIYSHGGVYAHPAVSLGSHSQCHGIPSSPVAATPLSIDTPTKSSGNTERGLMKKLKGFDGLAMSIGNGNAESAEGGAEHGLSQSVETEGSSDGSDGNTTGTDQTKRKRSREGTPAIGVEGKNQNQSTSLSAGEVNAGSEKMLAATAAPVSIAGKPVGTVMSPGMTTALELRNRPTMNAKSSPSSVSQACAVVPAEAWLQNERELKRERRKQSNRESARRSRLRKQAETEELARKVESLTAENVGLKSEINQFTEKSEKIRRENATLLEKLKSASFNNIEDKRAPTVNTENLLSRVNNAGSVDRSVGEEDDVYEKNPNSGAKLHQLLDTSPRADAIAAG